VAAVVPETGGAKKNQLLLCVCGYNAPSLLGTWSALLRGSGGKECGAVYPLNVPRLKPVAPNSSAGMEMADVLVRHCIVPVLRGTIAAQSLAAFLRHPQLEYRVADSQVVV
jgi:hypothetical protein